MKLKTIVIGLIIIITSIYNLSATSYYYDLLSSNEKNIYNEMLNSIVKKADYIDVDLYDFEKLKNIYYSVLNDHPEYFYISNKINYSSQLVNDKIVSAKIIFVYYDYNEQEITEIERKLNTIKYTLLFETAGFSEFEIVKYCFDYLLENSTYDINSNDQSIISTLINKKGVCSSYAKSFKYIMDFFNIPCIVVEGKFKGSSENHLWNMVRLNGNWYHTDLTQADANNSFIDYSYFCVLENQIKKDHIIFSSIKTKETNSDEFFYLNNLNCYFNSFDIEKLKSSIIDNTKGNNDSIIFLFENEMLYLKYYNYLFINNNFINILMSTGRRIDNLKYFLNEKNHSIIILLDNMYKEEDLILINNFSKQNIKDIINNNNLNQNKSFKLLFKNKVDFEKAKLILINQRYIFELIENINSFEVIFYDIIYRFDLIIQTPS